MSEETARAHPYLERLGDRDALEVLATTVPAFFARLDGLTPEQLDRKPAPGKWSVREIVIHMADCEIAWAWRLRQVYGAEQAALQAFEQDEWARSYDAYAFGQAKELWTALRGWNVTFLRQLEPAQRRKTAVHPDLGEVTLWTLASIAAGHDLHHLQTLEKTLAPLRSAV